MKMYRASRLFRLVICLLALIAPFAQAETLIVTAAAQGHPAVGQQSLPAVLDALGESRRADDVAIVAFYRQHGERPFWSGTPRGAVLADALATAPEHGLPAADPNLIAAAHRRADAGVEIALMRGYLSYARALSSGILDPRSIAPMIKQRAERQDASVLLASLATATHIERHFASLVPSSPDYAILQARYSELRRRPDALTEAMLSSGPTLRLGDRDRRVVELRARLESLGQRQLNAAVDPAVFDPSLEAAVRRFQRDQGLNADGMVGQMTLAALNVGPTEQLRKLAVNLERMRWLNRPFAPRHIIVNQADFTVRLVDNGRVLFDERVVIGRRDRQTPEFSDEMEYLVFNPTWYVPRSIATKDILPKLHEDPGYLSRSNMVLTRADGGPMPADASLHDFTVYTVADFPYGIRQRPNPGNALGQVKFMFPNNHAIYLHDTPSRELFERDRRAYSSGCVRVRDPLRLAALLLAPQVSDPEAYIERLVANGEERYVHLERTVPVHLIYRTAVVDEFGELRFRPDVYGRDALVAEALSTAGVALPPS